MKEFNWENFKDENNKIAVHCKTEDEAKDFCKKMHEHGMEGAGKWDYSSNTFWDRYRNNTCYGNHGTYGTHYHFNEHIYTFLEWSDYMEDKNNKFTKADLKDGMVIECRDKDRFLVFGHKLLNSNGFDFINDIADDLTDKKYKDKDFDIMKVYKVNIENVKRLSDILKHENLELIWERNEAKKMTTEEMRKKLEELTGEKIKVEPSKEEMIGSVELYCYKRTCSSCTINTLCAGDFASMSEDFASMSEDKLKECYEKVFEYGKSKINDQEI